MKEDVMSGACSMDGRYKRIYIFLGKAESKRRFGRPRRRWEGNIRMDLIRVIGWEGVDWIHLAQDRDQWWAVLNTTINFKVPLEADNSLTS
jgi:hypothetical protein